MKKKVSRTGPLCTVAVLCMLLIGCGGGGEEEFESTDDASLERTTAHTDEFSTDSHVKGDANCDGSFGVADILAVSQYVSQSGARPPCPNYANFDRSYATGEQVLDGLAAQEYEATLSVVDLLSIIQYFNGDNDFADFAPQDPEVVFGFRGDINNDDSISIVDIQLLGQLIVGNERSQEIMDEYPCAVAAGDLDADGTTGVADLVQLSDYFRGEGEHPGSYDRSLECPTV